MLAVEVQNLTHSINNKKILNNINSVSYTHLTLPTNTPV